MSVHIGSARPFLVVQATNVFDTYDFDQTLSAIFALLEYHQAKIWGLVVQLLVCQLAMPVLSNQTHLEVAPRMSPMGQAGRDHPTNKSRRGCAVFAMQITEGI